ncbi:DUF4124 domain-containing protein [Chromohalobacter canadensis]|uniref:DUF4124 domain-containing protein n=1 Tax=Chromohalobacter canadensis TaxID=141389 RepID=UPI0021BF1B52|nr:DUF4124 domain-containing protein [Chromohalobacter canadensis]MCT8468879.1 DUF4124 domain-containing protein [Chromohalobacter canadensis]MCT8472931.1 DUF4124 domain-containing protein [Chromohalobacter canadensis]MCT8500383.1 DUF4124 domain-containing protein [Chromohalobacter canadensis]
MRQGWATPTWLKCAWALLMAGALGVSAVQATPVYRSVDAQGNVTFSDRPVGKKVDVGTVNTVPGQPRETRETRDLQALPDAATETEAGGASSFTAYERLAIAAPGNETTLPTGAAGDTQVRVAITPELRETDKLRMVIDGEVNGPARHATTFSVTELVRGEHTLRAEVVDAEGRVRQRSAPITLYVQRASRYLPANPNNPRNNGGSDSQ